MTRQTPPSKAVPILRYQHVREALTFLEDAFGLETTSANDDDVILQPRSEQGRLASS